MLHSHGDVVYNLYCLYEGSERVSSIFAYLHTGSDGLGFEKKFRVWVGMGFQIFCGVLVSF